MSSQGITNDEIHARNSTSAYWLKITNNADWYRSRLVDILQNYRTLGVDLGDELLLHPQDALHLAEDLENLGIAVLALIAGIIIMAVCVKIRQLNFMLVITLSGVTIHHTIASSR